MISVGFYDIENAKEIIKTLQKEDINFCDYVKLNKQIKQIENSMLNNYIPHNDFWFGNLPLTFDFFNCECSTGKTFAVITKCILFLERYACERDDAKGMLFVMQNVETCQFYANLINSWLNNIYAETIDSSMNENKIMEKLNKYPIIFITHEKYKVLAENEKERKQFSKDRILLIIDEFIDMSEKIWITDVEYEKLIVALNTDETGKIGKEFRKVTEELKEYFVYIVKNKKNRDKNLHIKNFKTDYQYVSTEIEKIKEYVRSNLDKQDLTDFYNANNKKSIYNVLDEIKEYFGGTCILENGKLYTIKRSLKLWGLTKNIMLDASGTLNYAYKLQKEKINFKLEKNFQVLDHLNFTIEYVEINTTKSSKKRYLNFYEICRKILEELNKDETLVVCARYEHQDKNGNEITDYFNVPFINHCQNFLGSNKYEDLKNVLIIDTFNISEKDYILEYLYYSNIKLEDDEQIKVKTENKHRHFENQEIDEYKNRRIANEFYQAIKRVNRKLKYSSRIVVITQHTEALTLACDMLKNYKYINTTDKYIEELQFIKEYKNEDNKENKTNNYIRAIEILTKILNNEEENINITIKDNKKIITKKMLRTLLEINSAPNFRRDVMLNMDFQDFLDENNIEVTNNTFEIPIK